MKMRPSLMPMVIDTFRTQSRQDSQSARAQFLVMGVLVLVLSALLIYQQGQPRLGDISEDQAQNYRRYISQESHGFEVLSQDLAATAYERVASPEDSTGEDQAEKIGAH